MERKKKAGVAILVSDKIDFKPTKIKRDKEGHYIMVKGSMQQEELMILNIHASNTVAPRYLRQVLFLFVCLFVFETEFCSCYPGWSAMA